MFEGLLVIVLIITAFILAIRPWYRSLTGKDSGCSSCMGGCHTHSRDSGCSTCMGGCNQNATCVKHIGQKHSVVDTDEKELTSTNHADDREKH